MVIYMFTPFPGKMIQFDEQISDHRVRHAELSSERTGFQRIFLHDAGWSDMQPDRHFTSWRSTACLLEEMMLAISFMGILAAPPKATPPGIRG